MKFGLLSAAIAAALLPALLGPCRAEPLTAELVKKKARAAAALLEEEGDAALETLKDENGEFRFAGGEGYVWVHNLEGTMIMHPILPALNGKSVLHMRDSGGFQLFVAMNELVRTSGEGWVPYTWPKPGELKNSPKVSYVVLATFEDRTYVAGSGTYDVTPAEIRARFPADAVYGR